MENKFPLSDSLARSALVFIYAKIYTHFLKDGIFFLSGRCRTRERWSLCLLPHSLNACNDQEFWQAGPRELNSSHPQEWHRLSPMSHQWCLLHWVCTDRQVEPGTKARYSTVGQKHLSWWVNSWPTCITYFSYLLVSCDLRHDYVSLSCHLPWSDFNYVQKHTGGPGLTL